MTKQPLSRRAFLRAVSDSAQGSLLVLSIPALALAGKEAAAAMEEERPFTTLNVDEAAEFAAIAARIIPSDETPGATEAGVIYFMDNILGDSRPEILPTLRQGLGELLMLAGALYGSPAFHALTAEQQDSLLQRIEDTQFFNTMRYLTLAGTFASPAYGGNQNLVGWQLIGFEDRHVWRPPYGYYDADYMENGA